MPNIGGTELITIAVILIAALLGALIVGVLGTLLLLRLAGKNRKTNP